MGKTKAPDVKTTTKRLDDGRLQLTVVRINELTMPAGCRHAAVQKCPGDSSVWNISEVGTPDDVIDSRQDLDQAIYCAAAHTWMELKKQMGDVAAALSEGADQGALAFDYSGGKATKTDPGQPELEKGLVYDTGTDTGPPDVTDGFMDLDLDSDAVDAKAEAELEPAGV